MGEESFLESRVTPWADCSPIWKRNLFNGWPNWSHLGFLIGTCLWGKILLPPSSGKKTKYISVLTCLLLASQQCPHWLFLLVMTWGRQSCFLPHAWGSRLVKAIWSQWNPHRKRGMDFKDLNKKKISLVKCYWKVKKAVSTISFRLCFLLFWVSKVKQSNRAESWDYWEWLQLGFQNLPTYFKGKQQTLFTQCVLLPS